MRSCSQIQFGGEMTSYAPLPSRSTPPWQDVAVVVFTPMYETPNLMDIVVVEATANNLAPYRSLAEIASATVHANSSGGSGSDGGGDREVSGLSGSQHGLFHGIAAAADRLPGLAGSSIAAVRRRAKRRLVSAHYIADAMHRVAWQSGMKPATLPTGMRPSKINSAYLQVRCCVWWCCMCGQLLRCALRISVDCLTHVCPCGLPL